MPLIPTLFSSDKAIYPDKLPKPPTPREMLEDINSMTQDDPIITFAETLVRKGTGLGGTDSILNETRSSLPVPGSVSQNESKTCEWLIDSLAIAAVRDTIRTKPSFTPKSPGLQAVMSPAKDSLSTPVSLIDDNVHAQLKQFSTLCTKGEDLIDTVETKLRQMDSHCQEILNESNK